MKITFPKLFDLCRQIQHNTYFSGHTTRFKYDLETKFEDNKRDSNRSKSDRSYLVKPPPVLPKGRPQYNDKVHLEERVLGRQSAIPVDTCCDSGYVFQVKGVRKQCQTSNQSLDVIIETDEFFAWKNDGQGPSNIVNDSPNLTVCNRDSGTWV